MERNAMPSRIAAPDRPQLVELLRPLPARERTAILAQAVHEGTMTRVGADQVWIALALDDNGPSVTRAA